MLAIAVVFSPSGGWDQHEKAYVMANAGVLTDEQIAYNLTQITGRYVSKVAVTRQRQSMGLVKKRGRGVCRLR
jgi:hypothetical protein